MRLTAEVLRSHIVCLRPTRLGDAEDLAHVLADVELYRFTGGSPPELIELRSRLTRQLCGRSPDGQETWLNWVVRTARKRRTVGTMQATVSEQRDDPVAELAWVIGTADQGKGLAKSAAALVADWLTEQGITRLGAHIHPQNRASQAVAASLGMRRTDDLHDGEEHWLTVR